MVWIKAFCLSTAALQHELPCFDCCSEPFCLELACYSFQAKHNVVAAYLKKLISTINNYKIITIFIEFPYEYFVKKGSEKKSNQNSNHLPKAVFSSLVLPNLATLLRFHPKTFFLKNMHTKIKGHSKPVTSE